jgi:hypothetical protein
LKPQIPWLRVVVEGVVIVGSILLAFGIDAWWDERTVRNDVAEALAAVRMESDGNHRPILEAPPGWAFGRLRRPTALSAVRLPGALRARHSVSASSRTCGSVGRSPDASYAR